MVCGNQRGLTLADWDILTFGMIVDYIIEYDNMSIDPDDDEVVRYAGQGDYDSF